MSAGIYTAAAKRVGDGYMGRRLSFFVPIHPIGQNAGRKFRTRFLKTDEMIAYQEAVALRGRNARIAAGLVPMECPVKVTLVFHYREDRPDNDGPQKPTQDALAVRYGKGGKAKGHVGAGLFVNDKQVVTTSSTKVIGSAVEGVEVTVEQVEAPKPTAMAENALGLILAKPSRTRALAAQRKLRPSRKDYR